MITSNRSGIVLNVLYLSARYFRKSVSIFVELMVDLLSESKLLFPCLGGGGLTVSSLVSSLVLSPPPLSIKTRRGSGDELSPVTRVGWLLLVFAATGVLLSDIQASCKIGVFETDTIGACQ